MRIHTATLFNCDAHGRIVSLRRPWSRSGNPPRFFMGRRADGNVWLFRYGARQSPWAAEAGVETLDAMRGRGYATAAVAAWAAALRRRGLLPLYSASWENVASQRVAEKVGAVCYGEDWEIE